VLILISILTLHAQISVSGGFKAGSPINDSSSSLYRQQTQSHWTGGPTVELHLPYHFSLEFDALYRNVRSSYASPFSLGSDVNPYNYSSFQKSNAWDMPLLLKYHLPLRLPVRPFISAGYQWTRLSTEGTYLYQCAGPQGSCQPANSPFAELRGGEYHAATVQRGLVAGAGVEFKTRYVTITPELRFNRNFTDGPRENRYTGLVGFTFGKH
jgi:Outer membrane protein beta-barrel domain